MLIIAYNEAMVDEVYYTVAQVADKLQVHWQTVLNYIKSGKLKALKLGKGYRISKNDLNKFVKNNQAKYER